MKAVDNKAMTRYRPAGGRTSLRKNNLIVRRTIEKHGMYQWQAAEKCGMTEDGFSRKLRHELPISEQERIVMLIERGVTDERKSCDNSTVK